jgi:4a-hydroxytetrahydrobiopterin dehydratase
MEKMTAEQILEALKAAPDWTETGGQIHRTYQFKDFVEAMKFVTKVAEQAELEQHHPDILIRWNKVTLTLSTHDAGGITEKDFALAGKSDGFARLFAPAAPPAKPVRKAKK